MPSAPVVARLRELRDAEWTWPQIAAAAGLALSVPHAVLARRPAVVRRATAEAVLAVAVVPAVPRHQRLVWRRAR